MSKKYNGWTNRESWLVNLWYGEVMQDFTNDYYQENENDIDIHECSQYLEGQFDSMLEDDLENITNGFIKDLLDLGSINWYELAETYISDCK